MTRPVSSYSSVTVLPIGGHCGNHGLGLLFAWIAFYFSSPRSCFTLHVWEVLYVCWSILLLRVHVTCQSTSLSVISVHCVSDNTQALTCMIHSSFISPFSLGFKRDRGGGGDVHVCLWCLDVCGWFFVTLVCMCTRNFVGCSCLCCWRVCDSLQETFLTFPDSDSHVLRCVRFYLYLWEDLFECWISSLSKMSGLKAWSFCKKRTSLKVQTFFKRANVFGKCWHFWEFFANWGQWVLESKDLLVKWGQI